MGPLSIHKSSSLNERKENQMSRLPKGCSNVCGDLAYQMHICRSRFLSSFSKFGYDLFWPSGLQLVETAWEKLPPSVRNRLLTFTTPFAEPCCLRTDITLAAVAYMSSHFSPEERPLRLSYADKVYLTPQKPETSLEKFQIGAELLGWEEEGADVEMLFLLLKYLEDVNISDSMIVIGDVTILRTVLENVSPSLSQKIVNSLISGNYQEYYLATQELEGEPVNLEFMKNLPDLKGSPEVLDRAAILLGSSELIEPIKRICNSLRGLGYEKQICIDLALARELNYYTGPVFEIYLPSYGKPVGGGGRYDGLLTQYGVIGQAMGFALDLEVIASVSKAGSRSKTAFVWHGDLPADSVFKRALSIIEKGVNVEMSWARNRDSSYNLSLQKDASFWVDLSRKEITDLNNNRKKNIDEWLGEELC